jgi:hypothetical protein
MEVIEQLGVALGLAALAGVNLYLTVLLVGLLVRNNWLQLGEQLQSMEVLGHPLIITVAAVLYLVEAGADKVPWVDSLWDSVHTVIRPVGGMLIAMQALGDMSPHWEIIAVLLSGGAAMTTHAAKAGGRLLINSSPEPFTNITVSLAEDAAVLGGVGLVAWSPVVALLLSAVLVVTLWILMPRIVRVIRASLWLVWNKIRMPGGTETQKAPVPLRAELSADVLGLLMGRGDTIEREVAWTCECLCGPGRNVRGIVPNKRALLVARHDSGPLLLVLRGLFKDTLCAMPLEGAEVSHQTRLLSDNVLVRTPSRLLTLRFPRGNPALVDTVCMLLREAVDRSNGSLRRTRDLAGEPQPAPEADRQGSQPRPEAPENQREQLAPLPSL